MMCFSVEALERGIAFSVREIKILLATLRAGTPWEANTRNALGEHLTAIRMQRARQREIDPTFKPSPLVIEGLRFTDLPADMTIAEVESVVSIVRDPIVTIEDVRWAQDRGECLRVGCEDIDARGVCGRCGCPIERENDSYLWEMP